MVLFSDIKIMKYVGKLRSKDKHELLIHVESTNIFEAEKKILKIFDTEFKSYDAYGYQLINVTSRPLKD